MPDLLVARPTALPISEAPYEPKMPASKRGSSSAAVAGAGGEPPRRPNGAPGPDGHYADITVPTPTKIRHVNPKKASERSAAVRMRALQQTMGGRNLLYRPGPNVQRQLSLAAKSLSRVVGGLDAADQRTLGTRLLGPEGLLRGQDPAALRAVLARVADPLDGAPTAHDRAVLVALMGDIGALYADTGATTGVGDRTDEAAGRLRTNLGAQFTAAGLSPIRTQDVQRVQRLGGSGAVGPTKKQERSRPSPETPMRSGIHDLGAEADERLGIAAEHALPQTAWQQAHIREDRVMLTGEPLAGHMSGSPAEILHVFDLLAGADQARQYTGVMDAQRLLPTINPTRAQLSPQAIEDHHARAAAAGAFLVGLGYHSAVEVAEGILAYTGQDLRAALASPRQDAGSLLGQGAATALIDDLFRSFSKPGPRA